MDDARLVNLDVSGTKEWQTKLAAAVADQSGQYRWAPDELRDELLTAELRWRSTPNQPRDMDAERDAWVQKLTSNQVRLGAGRRLPARTLLLDHPGTPAILRVLG